MRAELSVAMAEKDAVQVAAAPVCTVCVGGQPIVGISWIVKKQGKGVIGC